MGMKRILSVFLVVLLVFSLSACGEENPVVGTWVGTLDYSRILQQELRQEEGWEDLSFEGIGLQIAFEFKKNGTFSTHIDKESSIRMVESLLDLAVERLILELEKRNTTLESLGLTEEQLRQKLESQIDVSVLTEPLDFVFGTGYYIYRDGRIYIGFHARSLQLDPANNCAEVMDVTLEGDNRMVVTRLDSQSDIAEELLPGLIPFTLVKQ